MKNKNDKKTAPIATIIVTAIITAIVLTGLFQVFWYEPLKEKCNNETKNQLAEKEIVITDLRALLEKEKAEFNQFKAATGSQIKKLLNKIEKYDRWLFNVRRWGRGLAYKWENCTNYCEELIVPWTREAIKKFKKEDEEIKKGLELL